MICENPIVSKLDDELNASYKAVIDKASSNEKKNLITEQRHWLKHTRNVCQKEVCFKHAYWMRQAELAAFFEPKSPLYAKESDKAEAIRQVLATAPLYERTQSDRSLCRQLLADLKEMKNIRFIDPVVQTMSYEDPALDPWKQRFCEKGGVGRPFTFEYACDTQFSDGADIDSNLQECSAGYGLPPFKIFELPPLIPSGKTRYFFYADAGYGPVNRDYANVKPIFGSQRSGFGEFRLDQCDGFVGNVYAPARAGIREGLNYNSIIEYQQRYFILILDQEFQSYWLAIEPIDKNEICRWSPVKD